MLSVDSSLVGGMAAVGLGAEAVAKYLQPGVIVGCENSPESSTLTGDKAILESVMENIRKENPETLVRLLVVDRAYHSHHMKTVEKDYISLLGKHIRATAPKVPFFSSVTNTTISEAGELGSLYWARNLSSPVLFSGAVGNAITTITTPKVFLEIGPHPALAGPIRQILRHHSATDDYLGTQKRAANSHVEMLKAAGELWLQDHSVKFEAISGGGEFLPNLPPYPWHYEETLWHESRLSRDWRLRKHPHHDLLGSRVFESTDHNPTWRNILRLDEIRWIKEHEVTGDIVLPGVGYICMAAEAIRQITDSTDYTARKINIKAACVLQQGQDIELITHLQRARLTNSLDSAWYDFSVFSLNKGVWTQHAFGQIRPGSEVERQPVEVTPLPRELSRRGWYRKMQQMGLSYGPRFRGITNPTSHPSIKSAVASLANNIPDTESTYAVHPAAMDCLLQLLMLAASNGLTRKFNVLSVPTYIEEIYVTPPKGEMMIQATADWPPKAGSMSGDVIATSGGETVIHLKTLQTTALGDSSDTGGHFKDLHAATELEWKEDLNFMDASKLFNISRERGEEHEKLDRLGALCMLEAQAQLSGLKATQEHMSDFYTWLGEINSGADSALAKMPASQRVKVIDELYSELKDSDAAPGAIAVHRILEHVQGIFKAEVEPLDLLLDDGVLTQLYDFMQMLNSEYTAFLELLAHRNPTLRILEIGAGTGGTTNTLLPFLKSSYGERTYLSYTYTDISSGFFIQARERFKEYANMEYAILDISKDPMEQGFEPESFDLIIATNVSFS